MQLNRTMPESRREETEMNENAINQSSDRRFSNKNVIPRQAGGSVSVSRRQT
jgi:hypothetical protein